ncbi:hypothetical protein D9M71_803050 [compost metagenome]
MKPAPTTPTCLNSDFGTPAGRRAPLPSSCMETNSERIIEKASVVCRISVK